MRKQLALLLLGISSSVHAVNWDQNWSFWGEALLMRRTGIDKRNLVKGPFSSCECEFPRLLTAKRLTRGFEYEPGLRVGASFSPNKVSTFEAIYMSLREWEAKKKVEKPGQLHFPFENASFTHDFQDADKAVARYDSHFDSGETSYWYHMTPRHVDYFSFSLLVGLRYVQMREHFRLAYHKAVNRSHYNTDTNNYMGGVQVGASFDFNPTNYLMWTLSGKIGGYLNRAQARNFLGDDNDTRVLRNFKAQRWTSSYLGDFAFSLHIIPVPYLDFYGGYEVLCFFNTALAPNQLSHDTGQIRHKVVMGGNPHIQGFFAGLAVSF